jgi:hypothetical protein
VVIAGVTEFSVESTKQIINLLTTGNKRRITEALMPIKPPVGHTPSSRS